MFSLFIFLEAVASCIYAKVEAIVILLCGTIRDLPDVYRSAAYGSPIKSIFSTQN